MFNIFPFIETVFAWKSKTRVTSYELQVQILLVTSSNLRVKSSIHELRVQIHELED